MTYLLRRVALLALCAASIGCASRAGAGREPFATHLGWRTTACRNCAAASVRVEARMSTSLDGTPGQYLVTRVRNLRAHPVIVDLVFGAPDSADGDGHTPTEVHRLVLGAADDADCEKLVVPRLPRVGEIYIAGLERF